MLSLKTIYREAFGKEMSDEELQTLLKYKELLAIEDNDWVWQFYITQAYHRDCIRDIFSEAMNAAREVIVANAELTKRDLAKSVIDTSKEVAGNVSRRDVLLSSLFFTVIIAFIIAMAIFFSLEHGRKTGHEQGYAEAYKIAMSERAAFSWANQPDGKRAYQFSQTPNFNNLINCDLPGWYVQNGYCHVGIIGKEIVIDGKKFGPNTIFGWKLPEPINKKNGLGRRNG